MLDNLKQELQQIGTAIEARFVPQYAAPQLLCRFRRGADAWEFSYLAALPQGQWGALLQLTRNGKSAFNVVLNHPDTELPQWRDALHDVLTNSDRQITGFWLRLYLLVRGRSIECSRFVMEGQTPIGRTSTDTDRYYVARLSGWRQPCVRIVHVDNLKSRSGGRVNWSSVRLLPAECQQLAEVLHRLTSGPAAKPMTPLPQNALNQPPRFSVTIILIIVVIVLILAIAATVLPLVTLFR